MDREITFARLNAKDEPLVGVDHGLPWSEKNFKLLVDAEKEFLEGVARVRREIEAKYAPLLEHESDELYNDDIDVDVWGEWSKKYPSSRHQFCDLYNS